MEVPILIEQTADYNIYEASFKNYKQQFRMWHNGVAEVKFDNQFAKANNFLDREDLLNKMKGMREYLDQAFGFVPDWISVDSTGFIGFVVLGTQTKFSMN